MPFVGEIRMFAGNFAPAGWKFCDGATLPIAQNDVLFQLIGTTYGGDGTVTFGLPDLRGRVPVHQGSGFVLSQAGGVEDVTLTVQQVPAHTHSLLGTTSIATETGPGGNVLAQSSVAKMYIQDVPDANLAGAAVAPVGGSQPHTNLQPYLCVNFIISLFGTFPSPS